MEQNGNGHDKLEINSKYNVRYIAADPSLEQGTLHDEEPEEQHPVSQLEDEQYDGEHDEVSAAKKISDQLDIKEPEDEGGK